MSLKVKNITGSIIFLLGLLGLLIVSSWFFQPKRNTEAYGMEDWRANGILGEPEQTIDVLFLGDSVTYCAINPFVIWEEQGITSYVCSTPLQKLYYTKEFLNKAFQKQSPKIVVLGTSTIFNDFFRQDKQTNIIEQIFPVFRYHDRWKEAGAFPEFATGMQIDHMYVHPNKGYHFMEWNAEIDEAFVRDYTAPTEAVEWMADINKEAVAEIKEFCEKHNAELILLSEPNVAGSWTPIRHNAIALLAEEHGILYVDLNYMQKEVPIDWSKDFSDMGEHLNYYGAKKVSSYMGKYLSDKGIFEDKRENVQYEAWNEAQEAFYESIREKLPE